LHKLSAPPSPRPQYGTNNSFSGENTEIWRETDLLIRALVTSAVGPDEAWPEAGFAAPRSADIRLLTKTDLSINV